MITQHQPTLHQIEFTRMVTKITSPPHQSPTHHSTFNSLDEFQAYT